MYKRLAAFVNKENILYDYQFGVRSGHSTVQAVMLITDKIQRAIEDHQHSCGLFLDFSKAFDTVNHTILIRKLEKYGIRGIVKEWFKSYLCSRKQFVSVGSTSSEEQTISCGVQQGSVLGPLLFLLYINDFKNCSNILDFHLFADDTNAFYSNKSLLDIESTINNQLINVNNWLSSNKLSLNVDKTNFVIFHPPQKRNVTQIKLYINHKLIKQVQSLKYLGVYLDSNLNWKSQIQYLSKKIKRSIRVLSKIRYYVNINILIQLYYSLIYPFLTYAITIWGNTYESTLKQILILQKKAIRIITFSDFKEHTLPLFRELKILRLTDLFFFHNALFM